MENITIKGIDDLNENERFELNKLIGSYKDKIKWKTKTDYALKLAIKKYSKNKKDEKDARAKYSISGEVAGQSQTFNASSVDWDFNKAVHKIFQKLINEIEHFYHSSEQRGKSS